MRYTKERIYELLPAIYREHDAKVGKPLEALLEIIAEQVRNIENDIENLYENWFIETCDEWLVPYIGDLVGANLMIRVPKKVISSRTWVANTVHYRRRKGTLFILEQLSQDVSGLTTIAVEFFKLLATTQHINHLRLDNIRTPDLRDTRKLDLLNTPFDTISHSIDVRDIQSGRGFYNIPNIGIFLWRLQAYPVSDAPAFNWDNGRYGFSQLGRDTTLFNFPVKARYDMRLSKKMHVADRISTLDLKDNLKDYYGIGKSILIKADSSIIEAEDIIVSSLQDWTYIPPEGKVALDPSLGRIAFSPSRKPEDVHVTYHYGFSADIGGGFYERGNIKLGLEAYVPKNDIKVYKISKLSSMTDAFSSISDTLNQWTRDGKPDAAFEILDSEFYEESFELALPEKITLIIRSAPKQRPVLRADPDKLSNEQCIVIVGDIDSNLILDGLLIDETLSINMKVGNMGLLGINHCTLVPTKKASVELLCNKDLQVVIQRSICGKIVIRESQAQLILMDTIVDGNVGRPGHDDDNNAIEGYEARIENCTIFGKVDVNLLTLATNSIFTERVISRRRQEGCVRFSYIPKDSKVPICYHCISNISISNIQDNTNKMTIPPRFTSENYGDPGYAQLHKDIGSEIFEGGDNGAEMGAFNHLYQAQRLKNLNSILDEYLPFGMQKGIVIMDSKGVKL